MSHTTDPAGRIAGILLLFCSLIAAVPARGADDPGKPPPSPVATPSTSPSPAASSTGTKATSGTSANDCAGGEAFKSLSHSANSPAIVYNGNLVPAGSSIDFGLATTINDDTHYFAVFLDEGNVPRDDADHGVSASKASPTDDLVVKHLLSAGQTIVSVDVPVAGSGFWTKRHLYIYQCSTARRPINVSYLPVYVSPFGASILFTLLIGGGVYFAAARSFRRASSQTLTELQYWNPIRITAGPDNRGSLSTFQVLFFSLLVFVMLAFVLMRTGVLSDLSTTVLEQLGISGLGAVAAKGADSSRTTLDPANQAWLMNKGWFDAPKLGQTTQQPSFFDLISSDGNFDVYRFQSLMLSGAVGGALFIGGVSQLSAFTVPQNILNILGLSQVVYVAGKLVNQSSASQINAVITDLRSAEAEFRDSVLTYQPAPGAAIMAPPASLDDAIARVGAAAYAKYFDKAKAAAQLFGKTTGLVVDASKLGPSFGAS